MKTKEAPRVYRMFYSTPADPRDVKAFVFLNDNKVMATDHAAQVCRNEGWKLLKVEYLGMNEDR